MSNIFTPVFITVVVSLIGYPVFWGWILLTEKIMRRYVKMFEVVENFDDLLEKILSDPVILEMLKEMKDM